MRRWPRQLPKACRPLGCWFTFSGARASCACTGESCALHGPTCRGILLIGSPMFLMQLFGALMFEFVNHQAGEYGGNVGDCGMGRRLRLFMVANMPVYGINQGTQPIVGFNYGAKRFDRVKQALLTGILYASTLTVLGFIVAMLIPGPVMELFINAKTINRSVLIELGVHAMRLCFLLSPLVGFQVVRQLLPGHGQAEGSHVSYALATGFSLSRWSGSCRNSFNSMAYGWRADLRWVSSLITGVCLFFELRRLDSRHQETTAAAATNSVLAAEGITAQKQLEDIRAFERKIGSESALSRNRRYGVHDGSPSPCGLLRRDTIQTIHRMGRVRNRSMSRWPASRLAAKRGIITTARNAGDEN